MTDPRAAIFEAVRKAKPDVFNHPVDGPMRIGALDSTLDALQVPRAGQVTKPVTPAPKAAEPRWLAHARQWIGTAEIPGPRHNPAIVKMRMALGGFGFKDDDIPWCGDFVAHCIKDAGLAIPKLYPRALAWADWGKACKPTVGAVVVFKRNGGGHVGFLVGEDAGHYHVLGGNQSNAVNIMRMEKGRMVAIRWPGELGLPVPGLPKLLAGGKVSRNEA